MSPVQSAMVKVAVSAGFLLVVTARLVRSKQPREHWGLVAPTHLEAGAALVALYLA